MKNVTYINASAGSGKTYTLTHKLAELIKSGLVRSEQVMIRLALYSVASSPVTHIQVKTGLGMGKKGITWTWTAMTVCRQMSNLP